MVTGLASIADNPERAQPGDALPSVEVKGQAGDTNGVGEHNGESSRDDSHQDVGAPSSVSVPAYQEARRSRSPVSAESTAFSPAGPFHSPPTPGSTRASTLAVSQKVNRSPKSPSYDLEPMRISSSGFITNDGMNTLRDPSPVQSQLPDGSAVEPNIYVQMNNTTTEARSSLSPPARRRIRPTTLNEESHWDDSDDSHGRDGVSKQSNTEYCPLSTDDEGEGNDHQDSDEDKGFRRDSRKRRTFGNPSVRPRSTSKRNCADTATREHGPRDMLPSATSPPLTDDIDGVRAELEEWALQNVRLKRTIVNNRATFQLQFD